MFYAYVFIIKFLRTKIANFNPLINLKWAMFWSTSKTKIGWQRNGIAKRYAVNPLQLTDRNTRFTSLPNVNTKLNFNSQEKMWFLFLQNWAIFRPKTNLIYNTNREFRLLFLSDSSHKRHGSLISAKRYFSRWLDSYNFLFNLFYVNSQIQLLSTKVFLEEALIFNWQYNFRNYKLFKFVQPFFTFKDLPHGSYIHTAVLDIFLQKLDLLIITDLRNHYTLLGYLQKYSLFSVGLVPINYSPWTVSYPIPTFSDSPLMQYYFLRLLFYLKSSASLHKHKQSFSNWLSFTKFISK